MVDQLDSLESFFAEHENLRPFADLVVYPPTLEEAAEEFPESMQDGELCRTGNWYTRTPPLTRLALYVISRRQGNGHTFASMVACQKSPQCVTEDVFWAGRPHFAQVYGENYYQDVCSRLAAQGKTLGAHEEYMPELARFKGDPQAVVSRAQGRTYIRQVCEQRGWACEGMVNVKGREVESDPLADNPGMAPDLIQTNAQQMIQKNPNLSRLPKHELRQKVLQKHGPQR